MDDTRFPNSINMQILSENQLDAFPADAQAWMLLNGEYSNTYLRFPIASSGEPEIVGFIEKEDAEQMINLLKTLNQFKHASIELKSELLKDVRSESRLYEQYVYFLSHELAQKFFKQYLQAKNVIK